MVHRYNNNPGIFSRSRRAHHPQYAAPEGAAYREPVLLSRGHRGVGLGRRRAAAPVAVERRQPAMASGAPPRRRRAPLFGRRRQRAPVVEGPVGVQRRRASVGDRIAWALMRLRGSLTRRPGLKVSGRSFAISAVDRRLTGVGCGDEADAWH
jgi:hypothetical protein